MASPPTKKHGVTFRVSPEDHAFLHAEVERLAEVDNIQELLELRVLGAIRPKARTGPKPRRRRAQEEELDIA